MHAVFVQRSSCAAVLAATIFSVARAHADGPATGTTAPAKASTGTTDVTGGGFERAKRDDAKDPKEKDATELTIAAGGLFSSGNSPATSLTGVSRFRLRRDASQLSAQVAGNYARTGVRDASGAIVRGEQATTVSNVQGRVRYDYFLTDAVTIFLGAQARHDLFQGLKLRAQVDPGVGYYFVSTKETTLWLEAGYDFLYDVRNVDDTGRLLTYDGTIDPNSPAPLDKTKTQHSGRLFLGYTTTLNEGVTFAASLEFLQAFAGDPKPYRVAGDALVSAKLSKAFSFGTGLSVRYDDGALPGKEKLDTVTTVSLAYSVY